MTEDHRSLAPERPAGDPDVARVDGLDQAIAAVLPALEAFNRFEGPDRAGLRSEWLRAIDEPLPEQGVGLDAVLEILRDVVIPRGLRTGHPGFTSWVTTAPTTSASVGHLVSAVASPQRWWQQPGNHLDAMAVRWCLDLLGFPDSFVGTFTSGGSTANLVGIGAARQHAGERIGIDPSLDGIVGLPEPRVYATSEVHQVVTRAMGVLGMGRRHCRSVPMDPSRRADLDALDAMIREDLAAGRTPVAVVGNAGDVNTGIVDPLPQMAAIAHEHGIWFHVDGAYDRERTPTEPAGDLESPWSVIGGRADWSVDFSVPTRGLPVWAVLKEIGAEGMRERVRRHNDFARIVADHARREPELELLSEPQLSIACFRYRPQGWDDQERLNELNAAILAELRRVGRSLPSSTDVDGAFAIRACYINPRNDREHVEHLIADVLEAGRKLSAER